MMLERSSVPSLFATLEYLWNIRRVPNWKSFSRVTKSRKGNARVVRNPWPLERARTKTTSGRMTALRSISRGNGLWRTLIISINSSPLKVSRFPSRRAAEVFLTAFVGHGNKYRTVTKYKWNDVWSAINSLDVHFERMFRSRLCYYAVATLAPDAKRTDE